MTPPPLLRHVQWSQTINPSHTRRYVLHHDRVTLDTDTGIDIIDNLVQVPWHFWLLTRMILSTSSPTWVSNAKHSKTQVVLMEGSPRVGRAAPDSVAGRRCHASPRVRQVPAQRLSLRNLLDLLTSHTTGSFLRSQDIKNSKFYDE